MIELKLKILAIFVEDGLEDEAGEEGLDGGYHDEATNNEGGELSDEASVKVGNEYWNEENCGDDGK